MILRALVLLLLLCAAARAEPPPADRRSGYEFMGRDTRAMQDDDATNPATLWVLDGEALWRARAGASNKACADCHGDAGSSMRGTAARYPAFDASRGKLLNLEQRINLCRTGLGMAEAGLHDMAD